MENKTTSETRLVVYRKQANILASITMPKTNADELVLNGKTTFKGIEYFKNNVTSITRGHRENCKIDIIYSNFDKSIVCANDEKGVRHQPNYLGYNGKKLNDIEFKQMLELRFGYEINA